MWKRICAALLLTSAAGACATGPSTSDCGWVRPIHPTAADVDVISQDLVDQILAHNRTGAELGYWGRRPARPERVGTVP